MDRDRHRPSVGVLLRLRRNDLDDLLFEVDVLPLKTATIAEPQPRVDANCDKQSPLLALLRRGGVEAFHFVNGQFAARDGIVRPKLHTGKRIIGEARLVREQMK